MPVLTEVFRFWVKIGILDVLLPFMLIFTVLYSILNRSRVLGEKDGKPKKRVNALMSLVVGLIAVAALRTTKSITLIAQYSAAALVILMLLFLVLGLLGARGFRNKHVGAVIGMLIMGAIGIYALGAYDWISADWIQRYALGPLVIVGVLALLVWMITHEKKPATTQSSGATQRGSGPPPTV